VYAIVGSLEFDDDPAFECYDCDYEQCKDKFWGHSVLLSVYVCIITPNNIPVNRRVFGVPGCGRSATQEKAPNHQDWGLRVAWDTTPRTLERS